MARFLDDRAPLEFTKPSAVQVLVVCPKCKTGRTVGKNTYSLVCSRCNTYFKVEDGLPKLEMENLINTKTTGASAEYMKFRTEQENKAENFRTKVAPKHKNVTHEPGLNKRKW